MSKVTGMRTPAVRWPPRVEKRRGPIAPAQLRFRRFTAMNGAFSTRGAGLDLQARQAAFEEVDALIRRFVPEAAAAAGEEDSTVTPAPSVKTGRPK